MTETLYRTLADKLRARIDAGVWKPGERLPSELSIADSENVSKPTVRAAIAVLVGEGLVVSKLGSGHVVRQHLRPLVFRAHRPENNTSVDGSANDSWSKDVRDQGREPRHEIRTEQITATGRVAELLGLPVGSIVVARRRTRLVDGETFSTADSYYPHNIVRDTSIMLPQDVQPGVYRVFEEMGRPWTRTTDLVSARAPTQAESRLLAIHGGVAVLEVARRSWDKDGIAVRLQMIVLPGDRNIIEYVHGEVAV